MMMEMESFISCLYLWKFQFPQELHRSSGAGVVPMPGDKGFQIVKIIDIGPRICFRPADADVIQPSFYLPSDA